MRFWALGFALVMLLAGSALALADEAALEQLTAELAVPLVGWHCTAEDNPAFAAAGFDDSTWQPVEAGQEFLKLENTTGWVRLKYQVPEELFGFKLAGQPLIINLGTDDLGDLYVDGQKVQSFRWESGLALLTRKAEPGRTHSIAVRITNERGLGSLRFARLLASPLQEQRYLAKGLLYGISYLRWLADQGKLEKSAVERDLTAALRLTSPTGGEPTLSGLNRAWQYLHDLYEGKTPEGTVHLLGHAHIDMNWLWLWPETLDVCRNTYNDMLSKLVLFPDFRFSQSTAATYEVLAETDPDLIARIKDATKSGGWEMVGATWVEGEKNMASGEALARHLLYAKRFWLKEYGVDVTTGFEPDTFGHAWTLPMILSKAGVDTYYFCRAGKGLPLFWWEAPDGSRVLAYNSVDVWYNDQIKPSLPMQFTQFQDRFGLDEEMWVYGAGDHGGGPRLDDIETALGLMSMPAGPTFKFNTLRGTMDSLKANHGGEAPVVATELNTTFEGCYTSHAEMHSENRRLENLISSAEAACLLATPAQAYPAASLTKAWTNVLFNHHHDPGDGTSIEAAYPFHHALFEESDKLTGEALAGAFGVAASLLPSNQQGVPVMIFNALPWKHQGEVTVDLPVEMRNRAFEVVDRQGKPLQFSLAENVALTVLAEAPALGYEVFYLRAIDGELAPGTIALPAATLENRYLRLTFDAATGRVLSFFDKSAGRELAKDDAEFVGLEGWLERPVGNAWVIGKLNGPEPLVASSTEATKDALGSTLTTVYEYSDSTLTRRLRLPTGRPWLEVKVDIDWREKPTRDTGSHLVKLAFPAALEGPAARFELPFGSMERGANGAEVPAQRWVTLTEYTKQELGAPFTQLDLSSSFNATGCAEPGQATEITFDHGSANIPPELFPEDEEELRVQGVPYLLPSRFGANNIECEGQKLAVDSEAAALYFLVAATRGSRTGQVEITYADGSKASALLHATDWASKPASQDEVMALYSDYRLNPAGQQEACPIVINSVAVSLPKLGKLKSLKLPIERDLHVFAITTGPGATRGEGSYSLAIINNSKYGHSVQDTTARLTLVRGPFNPHEPDPTQDPSSTSVTVRVYPHQGDWHASGMQELAAELNRPLLASVAPQASGNTPPDWLRLGVPCLSLAPGNLVFSAVKQGEDDSSWIVRFHESVGLATKAVIKLPVGVKSAEEVDLLERKLKGARQVTSDGQLVKVQIKPYEVLTLKISLMP